MSRNNFLPGDELPASDLNAISSGGGIGVLNAIYLPAINSSTTQCIFHADESTKISYADSHGKVRYWHRQERRMGVLSGISMGTKFYGGAWIGNLLFASSINGMYVANLADASPAFTQISLPDGATGSAHKLASDGTNLFFTNKGGTSGNNDFDIREVSFSADGQTLTTVRDFTLGGVVSGEIDSIAVDADFVYAIDHVSPYEVRKFSKADGTLLATDADILAENVMYMLNRGGELYAYKLDTSEDLAKMMQIFL